LIRARSDTSAPSALAVLVTGTAALLPVGLVCIAGWIAATLTRRRLRERALDAA
jgi:hypothetical protein